MRIKEITARKIKDSRGEDTVEVHVKSEFGTFITSSPSGKSKGRHEVPAFVSGVDSAIKLLKDRENSLCSIRIEKFRDLELVEKIVNSREIGANALYALEASILKAMAYENKKELWDYLKLGRKMPVPICNIIGGGLHTSLTRGKRADFQEFLAIPRLKKVFDNIQVARKMHEIAGERLKLRNARGKLNDENAWSTELGNEDCLEVLHESRREIENEIDEKVEIGVDVAASSFYSGLYEYKNPEKFLGDSEQIIYMNDLMNKYDLYYIEDPLNEEDFAGFRMLREKVEGRCLIVGDDLTTSNVDRLVLALKSKSISGIIVKPNQIGSLLEIKKLIDLAKKYNVVTIMSHRSGETLDYTISDLAFAWQTDFIKTRAIGKEGDAKFKRLIEIEGKI